MAGVMDPECDFDGVRNVGIKDGSIALITAGDIFGTESIDATNHVVAPGFIDTEQHGLGPWGIKVNLRDGVTTQMDFEVGALNIDEWYAAREGKTQANFGTVVGQEFARMRVHDSLGARRSEYFHALLLQLPCRCRQGRGRWLVGISQ